MIPYEPSPYTALSIYVFAMAHHFKVAINVIGYPGMSNIEESTPGRFLIRRPKEGDERESFVPDVTVCTYNRDTELWYVELPGGEVLIVRDDGVQFTVVGNEK
jgi:hypothetical protein